MVLDAKAMDWAAQNELDTKKLKAARIPIYGKWYFPEIPAGELMVNLKTGQLERFGPDMRAGEVLYVRRDDLLRARLGPYARADEIAESAPAAVASAESPPAAADVAPARAALSPLEALYDQSLAPGEHIHMPSSSIFPLVLGVGVAITFLGLVIGPLPDWLPARIIIVALGLVYCIAAGFGWAAENRRDMLASESGAEHGSSAAE